jgi:membrane-bound lytic murein transglycosylase F
MRAAPLIAAAALLVSALALAGGDDPPPAAAVWTDKYDAHFRKYAKRYFGPTLDWQWFKAQGIQESGLNPAAVGANGGNGIMQVLPSTFEMIRKLNPRIEAGLHDPRWNIAAGIYYDFLMYQEWEENPSTDNRLMFAFASYNAGPGRIQQVTAKAKAAGKDIVQWKNVRPFAPPTTRDYVDKITRHRDALSSPDELRDKGASSFWN